MDVKGGAEGEDEEDVFPTGDVLFIGRGIVEICLVGVGGEGGTVGSDVVGPREVVVVRMRKRGVEGGGVGLENGRLVDVNGTEGVRVVKELEGARNVSGIA